MAFVGSATCSRCGASFATDVARCPFCGASADAAKSATQEPLAPAHESAPKPSLRARPSIAVAKKQPIWIVPAAAAIVLAGAMAIVLIGGRATKNAVTVASVAPIPKPSASAERGETTLFADPARVDPSDLYPRVKARALAWNADARLSSITANPVLGDKVDLTKDNAEIVYLFGADLSARVHPFGHLAVTVRRSGMDEAPWSDTAKTGPAGARAAAPINVVEPNCVFDAAAKAAHASGVPTTTAMKLRYEADGTPRRGVWTARVPGHAELDRVIDGQTCAIVTRR